MQELRDLFAITRRRWATLLIFLLLGGVAAAGLNLLLPVTYSASAQIFVATPDWNDSTSVGDPNAGQRLTSFGDEFSQMRMASYQRVADTPGVLQPVIERLNLDTTPSELAAHVTTRSIPDTVILSVEARDSSGPRAAQIADAVAQQLSEYIKELERPASNSVSPIQPLVLRAADVPTSPISPRVVPNILAGCAVGLIVGLTWVAFRETRQQRREASAEDVGNLLGVLTLNERNEVGEVMDVGSDARFLRVSLTAALHGNANGKALLTAPRSTPVVFETAVQLAKAMAEVGTSVVVVMADFTQQVEGRSGPGLGDVLAGRTDLGSAIVRDDTGRLGVLPAGAAPANVTAALAGPAMRTVIDDLSAMFDAVLVVGPAVLESTDAVDLASCTGAHALVCPPRASRDDVLDAQRLLALASSVDIGGILVFESDALERIEVES
ncbi:Wzz/FepE/Etk N-terminal domain-containing protein [Mycobacterium sp. MYCO198283]|uniref:Wzz/FepE/Etk N-terminal domain-containing protein n=1 Tax=Mycobacterium sp. MYCO198283 TaxID=2883505 RepID=UPI001E5D9D43|nr:Wzz/FepE/Etk N-terminal domain-containing protein [Mycobacterium sp. MYCO198283]MCG5431644.1 Wzz/FepE/Etk N-terminal domain-containing protein [Mycobacterium sp. MYCO198283]